MTGNVMLFEWDAAKDRANIAKHSVSFKEATKAFDDPLRIILQDIKHSEDEIRYYCFGKVSGKVMTVRYTFRHEKIRIIGAAYWRDGGKTYAKENRL